MLDNGSNGQKPLSSTFRVSGRKKNKDYSGSRLARMSEKSYKLLCKIFGAIPEIAMDELEPILGKKIHVIC